MTPNPRHLLLPLLALVQAACQSTDPAFLTPEGRPIADIEPIPFRIAVAPPRPSPGLALQAPSASGLRFTLGPAALHERLVAELAQLRTASDVFPVGENDLDEAKTQRADLLLRPTITAVHFAHEGASSDFLLSSFLWITTWLGGHFVSDSTYDARLEVDWELVNPFDNGDIDNFVASSEQVDLSFWGRNDAASLSLLQTLVLPPVLTTDSSDGTSESLTTIAASRVAARLAGYLKSDFAREVREVLGEFRLDAPRNGSLVGGNVQLRGRIIAADPITAVNVYVNDAPVVVRKAEQLPPAIDQSRGRTFQLPILEQLALRPGNNQIAIEYAVRGKYSSRTITVDNPGTTGDPTPRTGTR